MATAIPPVSSDSCFVLLSHDITEGKKENVKQEDVIKQLESKEDEEKIEALKKVIGLIVSGENCAKCLVPVIKFCLRSENHTIKKLLLVYWEVVDKYVPGTTKLLPEFILVCNNLRNDLNHPNEYIRGCTLRFLTKVHDVEILESLIPAINANLEHRHSYIRKNAVLTVFTIYQCHPELIPDASELIEKFLLQESNMPAKRNAFLMLFYCDQDKAINFLNSMIEHVASVGENFQLVMFELIRNVCRTQPGVKSLYFKAIYTLVNSTSHAVSYEAANTLIALSSAPTAVRASITAYTNLLHQESDNNIKLVIVNRLIALKTRHEKLLQENIMEIMRSLSSPNVDIRRKTLELVLDLVSVRNVDDVVQYLRKELLRLENVISISNEASDRTYRKLLIEAIYQCALKFPDVVTTVVSVLMTYLGVVDCPIITTTVAALNAAAADPQNNVLSANPIRKPVTSTASVSNDVISFLREIIENNPSLRGDILKQLIESFSEIKTASVYRVALWILGEYADALPLIQASFQTINTAIGTLPLLPPAVESVLEIPAATPEKQVARSKVVVLADGTYAHQSAEEITAVVAKPVAATSLRLLLVDGDYFLAAVLGNTLTKLSLRYSALVTSLKAAAVVLANRQLATSVSIILALLTLGTHQMSAKKIESDARERLTLCVHALMNPEPFAEVFLQQCRTTFCNLLEEKKRMKAPVKKTAQLVREADDLIVIRQFKSANQYAGADEEELDLKLNAPAVHDDFMAKLKTIVQLTGLADSVYAEAFVNVHEYDIVLDILVINQTGETLQNMIVELATSGDLKIVERPQSYTLGPYESKKIAATIKVSSTENGTIFGNIVYDSTSSLEKNVVVMNSIHMDIMDYIHPDTTAEHQFRAMWAEFEWENKVAVNTDILDLKEYMNHICKVTNMKVLTPPSALEGSCNFLAANLYATSIFGEDALLNLSIELSDNGVGPIVGYIRIRSKTQGIALSLGDKVQAQQRQYVSK